MGAEPADDGFRDLPGNPMMWILILSELAVFGVAFVGFAVARALDPALFDAGQAHLDRLLGGINTMVLVTSGWLAARAVEARRASRRGASRRHLAAAAAIGSVFLAIKGVEYASTIGAGCTIDTDTFFALYFLLTGFHAAHVVMGIVILAVVAMADSVENVETGAAFWHMVDLVWILLYPLVYLIR